METRKITRNHGLSSTKLYRVWRGMINRCYNSNVYAYKDYGGRGIIVCEEWKNDFRVFYDWAMSNGYKQGLSIDRIDNDGNYEPLNCRMADKIMQANNTRANRKLTYKGKTQTLSMWAKEIGVSAKTLQWRLSSGKSIDEVLSNVVKEQNRLFEYNGKTQTIKEWSNETGIKGPTLQCRIGYGWDIEKVLCTPVDKRKPKSDRMTTYKGKTQPLSAWAKELGIHKHTLFNRIDRGWNIERALTEPVNCKSTKVVSADVEEWRVL